MSDAGPAESRPLPDHADVITKPPLIYLAGVLLGLWLGPRVPLRFPLSWPLYSIVGVVLGAVALALLAWGVATFRRAGEQLDPHTPTVRILTGGPYRWTRNPLYLGLAVMQVAIGTSLQNAWIVLLTAPVAAVITWGVIVREERYLERKFGDEYRRYRDSVRRWI